MANLDFHWKDQINVLIRRRNFAAAVFLVTFLAATLPSFWKNPIYESSSSLYFYEGEKRLADFFPEQMGLPRGEQAVSTQIMVLKSAPVAEKTVKALNLRFQAQAPLRMYQLFFHSETKPDVKIKAAYLAEEGTGRYQGVWDSEKIFTLYDRERKVLLGRGESGKVFTLPKFSFTVEGQGKFGKAFQFEVLSLAEAAGKILGGLSVTPVRNTNIVRVSLAWDDPVAAREILDSLIEEYRHSSIIRKAGEATRAIAVVEEQLQEVERELNQTEEQLRIFKEKKGLVSFPEHIRGTVDQVVNYEKEYRTLGSYRRQAEVILNELKRRGGYLEQKALLSLGAGLNNNGIMELGRKYYELIAQRAVLATQVKETHPKIILVEKEIAILRNTLAGELSALIQSSKEQESRIRETMGKHEERIRALPAAEKEMANLTRVSKVNQGLSSFLLQKRGELSITKATETGNILVLEPATMNSGVKEPDIRRKIRWGLLFALIMAIGLAFLLEYMDTNVKTLDELPRITDIPYLGAILHFSSGRKRTTGELIMLDDPHSHIAEAFRVIRTNLLFTTHGAQKKFLMVTSSGPFEGKTFVSANLAFAMAQAGRRVLLVDADLRKPDLLKFFGRQPSPGLSDILGAPAIDFDNLPIQRTPVASLHFLPAGGRPANPAELLGSVKMTAFMDGVREWYDYVIFDSPPAFLTSDPFILAQVVEGVVIVVRRGRVKRDILRETIDRFLRVDTKVLGIVFNDMARQGSRYTDYKYRYYYSYYYGENGKRKKGRSSRPAAIPALPSPGRQGS